MPRELILDHPRRATRVFAATALLLTAAAPYRDPDRHFTVQLPDGWVEMAPELVRSVNELAKLHPRRPNYVTGFQPTGAPAFAGPYVLVHVSEGRLSGYTYDYLEKSIRDVVTTELQAGKGIVLQPSKADARIDRERNRIVIDLRMTVFGLAGMRGRSYGMMGADRIVYLNCYVPEAQFDKDLPQFEAMAGSFRYDDGHTFVPGSGRPFDPGFDWAGLYIMAIVCAIIAAGYAVRAGVRRLVWGRRSARRG